MNTMAEKKTAWHSEPIVWMLIALPLIAVIASITTYFIASKNADIIVSEEHVKDGFAVRQVLDRDVKAAELGVSATLKAYPGRLTIHLDGRFPAPPKNLLLTLEHPSSAEHDIVLVFEPMGNQDYTASYAAIPAGKRNLELTANDHQWRVSGQWQAPFSGSTELTVSTQASVAHHSPTQP